MQEKISDQEALVSRLRSDIYPAQLLSLNSETPKPARVYLHGIGEIAVYLWRLTSSRLGTGRPAGEMRVQVIIPGYPRGARQSLLVDALPTILLGYSSQHKAYCIWDARHRPFPAYSANLQATEIGCRLAAVQGIHVELPGTPRSSVHWRVYCRRELLAEALFLVASHVSTFSPTVAPIIETGLH